jgi:hypothetical protein
MKKKIWKDKKATKWAIPLLALLAVGAILLFFFHPTILCAGGRYLAPEGKGRADVVILEGSEVIKERTVRVGMELISSGRAKKLAVVYQESEERALGLPPDYDLFLIKKISELGLKKDQISVYVVPREHPITLNEARIVLSKLAKDKTSNAIVLTENFHTRRSYWVYKQVGKPLGIDIIPYPHFTRFKIDGWWQKAEGIRDFLGEWMKLLYYVLRGYIPIKSLMVT